MAGGDQAKPAWNAVVLAGGQTSPEMARLTGVSDRAMIEWGGQPFVCRAVSAIRGCGAVKQVVVVGPRSAADAGADIYVAECDNIVGNLRYGLAALKSGAERVLVTASDNPLLSAATFRSLAELDAAVPDSAVAYPVLRFENFLARFPGATHHIPVRLRDGLWIGGACVLLDGARLSELDAVIARVLEARKSLLRMLGLLGWGFALRYAARLVTLADMERRASQVAGMPVRFMRGCDPVLPIDIDEPVDLEYLKLWSSATVSERV